ncbi:MAG: heat-inducible transcriptional repressor HrcA [Gammaproteobacteria bacterium]
MLTEREKILIKNLVDEYISTGEAISSEKILVKSKLKCSAATIRKDLNNLESKGLIEATHTSSGRIPTVKGYRHYIDNNLRRKPLSIEEQAAIKNLINSDASKNNIISSTSEFISEISDFAAVIGSLDNDKKIFLKLDIHKLSSTRALAVVIMDNNQIDNKIIDIDNINSKKLDSCVKYLNENFAGIELKNIPQILTKSLETIRGEIDTALKVLNNFIYPDVDDFYITGQRKLVDSQDFYDIEKVKNLVELFEKKQTLKEILTNCISNENIQIYIGNESGSELLADCSVISAPYKKDNKTVGVLGVIGPKRMNYQRIVEIVDFTAKIFSKK